MRCHARRDARWVTWILRNPANPPGLGVPHYIDGVTAGIRRRPRDLGSIAEYDLLVHGEHDADEVPAVHPYDLAQFPEPAFVLSHVCSFMS
jgi:hypothetical protein